MATRRSVGPHISNQPTQDVRLVVSSTSRVAVAPSLTLKPRSAMKHINSRAHGIIDYVVGAALILAPYLFGFANDEPARNAAWIVGGGALLYSLFTAYELSIAKIIPYRVHLGLDMAAGLFLAASPWLMNFADRIVAPHLVVGLLEIGVALMSRSAHSAGDDHHLPHTPPATSH